MVGIQDIKWIEGKPIIFQLTNELRGSRGPRGSRESRDPGAMWVQGSRTPKGPEVQGSRDAGVPESGGTEGPRVKRIDLHRSGPDSQMIFLDIFLCQRVSP